MSEDKKYQNGIVYQPSQLIEDGFFPKPKQPEGARLYRGSGLQQEYSFRFLQMPYGLALQRIMDMRALRILDEVTLEGTPYSQKYVEDLEARVKRGRP